MIYHNAIVTGLAPEKDWKMETTLIAQGPVDVGVRPQTCGECIFAEWTRTPTGRIKKGASGRCGKRHELLEIYSTRNVAPCICIDAPRQMPIWPDYRAEQCPMGANAGSNGPSGVAAKVRVD